MERHVLKRTYRHHRTGHGLMILVIALVWVIVIPAAVTALGWWRGTGEPSPFLATSSGDRREITPPPAPIRLGTGSAAADQRSSGSRGMVTSR